MTNVRTIILKFAGPLQSWGTDSHFETRHTDFHPSKSAVIGLLAAALGYRRDDDRHIQRFNEIDFAIRVDQPGNLLRDYHTARKYKENGSFDRTYVTNRYYLEDAVFVAALSHADDTFMESIEEGLRYPYFQLFMGRRALPVCFDFFLQTTSDEIIDSLSQFDWQAAEWYMRKQRKQFVTLELYADAHLLAKTPHNLRKDRVLSFSQKERKFGVRYEARINIEVLNQYAGVNNTEHNAWDSIGD